MSQKETALAVTEEGTLDLSAYDDTKVNILTPVLRYDSSAPWLRFRAVEVRLNPDHEQGDCYPAPGSRWLKVGNRTVPAVVAPAKTALLKIASAVGLMQDPDRSGRIKPDACERCIELASHHKQAVQCGTCPARYDTAYQIVGAVRADTGWRTLKATYEWNREAQEAKLRAEAKKRAGQAASRNQSFDEEEHVRTRLDAITAERFGLAETKALLRLIRAICHIRHTYRREDMAHPFIVVRADLVPDLADPAIRGQLADRARAATGALFPPSGDPAEAAFSETPTFENPIDVGQGAEVDAEGADLEPIDVEVGEGAQEAEAEAPEDGPTICPGCDEILADARLAFLRSENGKAQMQKYEEMFGTGMICYKCQTQGDKALRGAGSS